MLSSGCCGALFTHGTQRCLLKMEGLQAVFSFDARATKGIDRLKDATRQLVTGRGTGDNVLPNPIEMSDIIIVDGRNRTSVFVHGVEQICPRVHSVYDGAIDLLEQHIDGGNLLVEIRETAGLDDVEMKPESTLEEIGLDSLGTVEILVAVEDEFGIQLDTEENPKTVGEFVDTVEAALEK